MKLTITCCRVGTYYKPNRGAKGSFKKEFKSLRDFLNFYVDNRRWCYYPNLLNEITEDQYKYIVYKLYNSKSLGSK